MNNPPNNRTAQKAESVVQKNAPKENEMAKAENVFRLKDKIFFIIKFLVNKKM